MRVIPSLEIIGGKAICRAQRGQEMGEPLPLTPEAYVRSWVETGAQAVDLLDIDGYFRGSPGLDTIIGEVAGSLGVLVQIGGGIRTVEQARHVFSMGVHRVCVGSTAMNDLDEIARLVSHWPDKVMATIVVVDDLVPSCTWDMGPQHYVKVVQHLRSIGVTRVLIVDGDRDGLQEGPNLERLEALVENVGIRVTVGTDVSSVEDIHDLRQLEVVGVDEVILRDSMHTGKLTLSEALEACI